MKLFALYLTDKEGSTDSKLFIGGYDESYIDTNEEIVYTNIMSTMAYYV